MGYFVSKHGFVFFATTCPLIAVCVNDLFIGQYVRLSTPAPHE